MNHRDRKDVSLFTRQICKIDNNLVPYHRFLVILSCMGPSLWQSIFLWVDAIWNFTSWLMWQLRWVCLYLDIECYVMLRYHLTSVGHTHSHHFICWRGYIYFIELFFKAINWNDIEATLNQRVQFQGSRAQVKIKYIQIKYKIAKHLENFRTKAYY